MKSMKLTSSEPRDMARGPGAQGPRGPGAQALRGPKAFGFGRGPIFQELGLGSPSHYRGPFLGVPFVEPRPFLAKVLGDTMAKKVLSGRATAWMDGMAWHEWNGWHGRVFTVAQRRNPWSKELPVEPRHNP